MRILVELTQKGENASNSGRTRPLLGHLAGSTSAKSSNDSYELNMINVQWQDGSFGRYNPTDKYVRIIGFSNY